MNRAYAMRVHARVRGDRDMGRDYLIVAYRGPALSELEIARLVRRVKPLADLYRHAPARARPRALADLHCIALYDQVVGSSSRPGGEKLYFPEDKLAELERVAAEPDRPLSWLVQAAWKLARAEIMSDARKPPEPPAPKLPEPPDPTLPELSARLLSRKTPEAFRDPAGRPLVRRGLRALPARRVDRSRRLRRRGLHGRAGRPLVVRTRGHGDAGEDRHRTLLSGTSRTAAARRRRSREDDRVRRPALRLRDG